MLLPGRKLAVEYSHYSHRCVGFFFSTRIQQIIDGLTYLQLRLSISNSLEKNMVSIRLSYWIHTDLLIFVRLPKFIWHIYMTKKQMLRTDYKCFIIFCMIDLHLCLYSAYRGQSTNEYRYIIVYIPYLHHATKICDFVPIYENYFTNENFSK